MPQKSPPFALISAGILGYCFLPFRGAWSMPNAGLFMASPRKNHRLTNQFLVLAGELLYGRYWQSQLYVDLGISLRTLAYYKSGDHPVPMSVIHNVIDILRNRHIDIINALPSSTNESTIIEHLSTIIEGKDRLQESHLVFPSVFFIKNYIKPTSAIRQMKFEKLSPEKITRLVANDREGNVDVPFAEWAYSLTYKSYFRRHVISDERIGRILYFAIAIEKSDRGFLALFEENRKIPSMTFDLQQLDPAAGNWPYLNNFSWLS
ncbi:MAG: hypothetical protein V7704_06170 [Aurantimonas endophytica]|uniref:hypothetical protein n=1 Tax=Aurantimonas endophytica TaxID=1522175 RepID=UPI00300201B2